MTRTSAMMGSPYYMSPEQMRSSKEVDARSDIWALGVILFELVTGQTPFLGETVTDLAIKIATVPAPLVRSVRADVPQELERVISKCLAKDRAQRFQNVSELAVALKDFGSRRAAASVERILGTHEHAGGLARGSSPAHVVAPAATHPGTQASFGKTGPRGTCGREGDRRGRRGHGDAPRRSGEGSCLVRRGAPSAVPPATALATAAPVPAASADPSVALSPPTRRSIPPRPRARRRPTRSPAPPAARRPCRLPPSHLLAPPRRDPARAPAAPPSAKPAAPPAKSSCNPPYVIDAAGHRQYKPECL